ncbi:putative quinate 5-dehydrogenase QutB [Geopyxis carbonaria]|nr:putative quinate 5-dehydrogenase QutB [Geopyxis carbonaria]
MVAPTDILSDSYTHGTSLLESDPSLIKNAHKTHLFGHPISHSLAPLLQNTLFKDNGIPWSYNLLESLDTELFLSLLKSPECVGSAVTMPHKVTFMSQVDAITEEGRIIDSINTVFIRLDAAGKRRYIGTNTDCIGVRESFLQKFPGILNESDGKPALVIGGGGACRSAVYACWKWLGAPKIYLVNRDAGEIEVMVAAFIKNGFKGELIHVDSVEQAQALETPVVVVGTVPDFPPKEEGEIRARKIVEEFLGREKKGYMLEMCYHPKPVTELYVIAERQGWQMIDGTEPMIHQGIAQQMLWAERPLEKFEVENAKKTVYEELKRRWT